MNNNNRHLVISNWHVGCCQVNMSLKPWKAKLTFPWYFRWFIDKVHKHLFIIYSYTWLVDRDVPISDRVNIKILNKYSLRALQKNFWRVQGGVQGGPLWLPYYIGGYWIENHRLNQYIYCCKVVGIIQRHCYVEVIILIMQAFILIYMQS